MTLRQNSSQTVPANLITLYGQWLLLLQFKSKFAFTYGDPKETKTKKVIFIDS